MTVVVLPVVQETNKVLNFQKKNYYLLFQINRYQGNPELEATRHMKNCINFIRRHEIH